MYLVYATIPRPAVLPAGLEGEIAHDRGYLAHLALVECLGTHAPRPYRVLSVSPRSVVILGYSDLPAPALIERGAGRLQPGDVHTRSLDTNAWATGQRLRFDLLTLPVKRKNGKDKYRTRAEVDVWIDRDNLAEDRPTVYTRWLADRLAIQGGAELVGRPEVTWRMVELVRSTHKQDRPWRMMQRTAASFTGVLRVRDADAFAALVRGGVGRARAFGYGMTLIRRMEG